jgi:hypothetical protein
MADPKDKMLWHTKLMLIGAASLGVATAIWFLFPDFALHAPRSHSRDGSPSPGIMPILVFAGVLCLGLGAHARFRGKK